MDGGAGALSSSTPRHESNEALSVDLFRSNLSPFQLLFVTMREYWRKSDHQTMVLGTIAKLGHYPISVGVLGDLNAWF